MPPAPAIDPILRTLEPVWQILRPMQGVWGPVADTLSGLFRLLGG